MSGDGDAETGKTDDAPPTAVTTPERTAGWSAYLSENAIEIWAAVLLSIATVATAWCAYQATRWSSAQQANYAAASAARVESSRAYNRGRQFAAMDLDLFADYAEAVADGNTDLQAVYVEHLFRPEFLPVLEAWLATDPLNNPDAPRSPFVDEAYLDDLLAESETFQSEAEATTEQAEEANQIGDEYILDTVFYAMVLFFAGISTKFSSRRVKIGLLGLGTLVFLAVLSRLLVTPIQ